MGKQGNFPLFFCVQKHAGSSGTALPLIFAAIRIFCVFIQLCKDKLSNSAARAKLDRAAAGVKEFQRDFSLKAGIHPSCILDEKP